MSFIKANSITKAYGQNLVIDDISFDIEEGRFYTILGLNGSGKSTLLNVLCGRVTKDKSDAEILGKKLGEDLKVERSKIGFVSEMMNLGTGFDVPKFLKAYSSQFETWDQEYFEYLNKNRKIDLSKKFSEYSRGQKMQLFLMVALAQRPKLLFVDEITSVLDYKARNFFLAELKKITDSGGTVVLTTNIITEVHRETTDLLILKEKKLLYRGKKTSLFGNFLKLRDLNEKEVPSSSSLFNLGTDALGKHSYLIQSKDVTDALRPFIQEEGPNLGEVFVFLTDGEFSDG